MRNADRTRRFRHQRQDMTDAERLLWFHLRDCTSSRVKFRRQGAVGPYVADFISLEASLVVELDGTQYPAAASDMMRNTFLVRRGFQVLRFWNHDVLVRTGMVLEVIHASVERRRDRGDGDAGWLQRWGVRRRRGEGPMPAAVSGTIAVCRIGAAWSDS